MEPIDFVVTWVDGNDPKWQAKRRRFADQGSDNRVIRYRDWGTLKYWFRGIESYAPWVNRVFFVTDAQIPDWLDLSYEKLRVIDHKDFIPERFLPTFNSNVIEMHLHRIPGLSEHFVYFNDDMFLTAPVQPTDFFRKSLPCDSAVFSPVICYETGDFSGMTLNNTGMINQHFSKREVLRSHPLRWFSPVYGSALLRSFCLLPWRHFAGFYETHLPNAFLKSSFETVWNAEGEYLERQSERRFRDHKNDVNQWLVKYWQFCEGNFLPRSPRIGRSFVAGKDSCDSAAAIRKKKYRMICINDALDIDFDLENQRILAAFEEALPHPSRFEKRDCAK